MALSSSYVLATGKLQELFNKIRDGQPPAQVTIQLIKDWGFKSTNDRAFIPLLKSLGFLSTDGKPTQRYSDFRDHSRSQKIMSEALKEAYGDLFLITSNPKESDKAAIKGKFKSFHNTSDNVASLMSSTFFQLLTLADLTTNNSSSQATVDTPAVGSDTNLLEQRATKSNIPNYIGVPSLNYNIQIHLPSTKDAEVYNAIFKSLREHLIEQ